MSTKTQKSYLQQLLEYLYVAWYRYSVTIPVYHMHPLENLVTNSCVLLLLYLTVWVIPRMIFYIIYYLVMFFMQSNANDTDAVLAVGGSAASYTSGTTLLPLPT